jgi:hypothetical protein
MMNLLRNFIFSVLNYLAIAIAMLYFILFIRNMSMVMMSCLVNIQ